MKARLAVVVSLLFGACVPYSGPLEPAPSAPRSVSSGPFEALDPGASELDTLHFSIRAYGSERAGRAGELAEESYRRIMVDTNLFSFRPRSLYRIVVYAGSDEYLKKTGMPAWSGGVTVGNAIYTHEGPSLQGTIAHEMSHLIFHEYMGRAEPRLRWVNEGLAVYQESVAVPVGQGARDLFPSHRERLRRQPLPIDSMIRLAPSNERGLDPSAWYAQAESMVRFMINRGGRIGFSEFLAALRDGKAVDEAVAAGYPGTWQSLAQFEADWARNL